MCHPDSHYALLRGEFESDAQNLEAESWSVAVDQNYLKALNKEAVKRQDVIYGKRFERSVIIHNLLKCAYTDRTFSCQSAVNKDESLITDALLKQR